MPVLLRLELLLFGAMLATGGSFLGLLIQRTWITAYAVTNQRLLMAVGRRHDKMRNVALADLAPVRIVFRRRVGKILFFYKINPTSSSGRAEVWTFLETGETD